MRRGRWTTAVAVAVAAALVGAAEAAATGPRRIVSINLCTDALLVDLVARERIVAVSHLAADPLVSPVATAARDLPQTRGEAEHVLSLAPDLVLTGGYTTPATLSLLERIGQRLVRVEEASDVDGIRAAIRRVAAAVDEVSRGEALVAGLDASLATAGRNQGARPTALIYQVSGLTADRGSLAGSLLAAAGLDNHARGLRLGGGGALPLEALVVDPPDLIVLAGPTGEHRTVAADNLRHPALRAVLARQVSAVVPWRLWLCGTHYAAEAVRLLDAARRALDQKAVAR